MKLPNFGYHLARAEGRIARAAYNAALSIALPRLTPRKSVDFDVCSYSGEAMLPEQVASLRSFLQHAGRPHRFVVFSDGTYSARSHDLLRSIDGSVEVTDVPRAEQSTGKTRAYLEEHPTGRQLALMMSLPLGRPMLYLDSDVLFFAGAANIEQSLARSGNAPALFLLDCQLSADERLFRSGDERVNPVNTGIVLFREKLDWSVGLDRFAELVGQPTFHTNQTLTHLAMHASGAAPLDPSKFVLQLDDQFVYRDLHARRDIIARHYVNPVRHKFWTALL